MRAAGDTSRITVSDRPSTQSSSSCTLSLSQSPVRDTGDGDGERSMYAGVESLCQLGSGISGSTDCRTSVSVGRGVSGREGGIGVTGGGVPRGVLWELE
jgi:hypothetical protein